MLKKILLVLLLCVSFSFLFAQEDASEFYQKGVDAKSIGERESNFEKALKLYMNQQISLKEQGVENGYLLYNIGNCYFNLNQLGEAILYYKQALKLLPQEEKIIQNYEIATKKRISPVDIDSSGKLSETLLFFHFFISEKAKILIMLILSTLILVIFLLYQKVKKNFLKSYMILFSLVYFIFLLSLFIDNYYPQREGVFIKDSLVYQDAGENYASLVTKPIGTGSTIVVINSKDGWYKVRLNDGRFGYVKESSLHLIL